MSNGFKNSEHPLSEQEMFEIVDRMQMEGYFDELSVDPLYENEAFEEVSCEDMERITKRVYEMLQVDRPVQVKHPFNQKAQENQEAQVIKSLFKNSQLWNTRRQWIVGIVGVFLIFAVAFNKQVFAEIEKVLHYIPGFGVVQEDAGVQRYKLDFPITTRVEDGQIRVESIFVDGNQTLIRLSGNGTECVTNLILKNSVGKEFTIHASSTGEGGNEWIGEYWYKGRIPNMEQATIQVYEGNQGNTMISIPIHLTKAQSFTSYDQMGPTQTKNGLSVTTIVSHDGNLGTISFVTPQSDYYSVASYGLGQYQYHQDKYVSIYDSSGHNLKISVPNMTMGTIDTGQFTLPQSVNKDNTFDLHITIPEIVLEYKDELTIQLPIPTRNAEQINKTFKLAGYPVTFTKIEPIDQGDAVRVYVNTHYNTTEERSLYTFNLDSTKMWGITSFMIKESDQTGAIEYFEIPVKDGQKQVSVPLTQPRVLVRGPWVFDVKK